MASCVSYVRHEKKSPTLPMGGPTTFLSVGRIIAQEYNIFSA